MVSGLYNPDNTILVKQMETWDFVYGEGWFGF